MNGLQSSRENSGSIAEMTRVLPRDRASSSRSYLTGVALGIVTIGFFARLYLAATTYLNPDEAQIYFLSNQASLASVYQANLTTAHPPLFAALLYYWRFLGNSELVLRLPSVLAGTLFCWVGFKWLGRITNRTAALVGLIFFSFSPVLISLSAEIRQYSLLVFFIALSLYALERAIQESSAGMMLVFSFSLCLAILTHYSALLFACVVGAYAILRLYDSRATVRVIAPWVIGQAVAAAVFAFLYRSHLLRLKRIAEVTGFFQGSGQNALNVLLRETFRLFHYLFSQPVIGGLMLLLYVVGLIGLLRQQTVLEHSQPNPRHLAFLLAFPFLVSWTAQLLRTYPFDGTRHSVFLAAFVIAGASLGLARWPGSSNWKKPLLAASAMAVCYLAPVPLGASFKPPNQKQSFMAGAVKFLGESAAPGAVVILDNQTSFPFRYYFCRGSVAEFSMSARPFADFGCGRYRVSATGPRMWMFTPENLSAAIQHATAAYGLKPGSSIWIFQTGWNVDTQPLLWPKLKELGCPAVHSFGKNIVVCQLPVS